MSHIDPASYYPGFLEKKYLLLQMINAPFKKQNSQGLEKKIQDFFFKHKNLLAFQEKETHNQNDPFFSSFEKKFSAYICNPEEDLLSDTDLLVFQDWFHGTLPVNGVRKSEYSKRIEVYQKIREQKCNIFLQGPPEFQQAVLSEIRILLSRRIGFELLQDIMKAKDTLTIVPSPVFHYSCLEKAALDSFRLRLCENLFQGVLLYTADQKKEGYIGIFPRFLAIAHEMIHFYNMQFLNSRSAKLQNRVTLDRYTDDEELMTIRGFIKDVIWNESFSKSICKKECAEECKEEEEDFRSMPGFSPESKYNEWAFFSAFNLMPRDDHYLSPFSSCENISATRLGKKALHFAALQNLLLEVRTLLSRGADPKEKDRLGNTPLHYAANKQGKKELAKLLLDAGAEVNVYNNLGRTPLNTTVLHDNYEILQLLLAHGASPNPKKINPIITALLKNSTRIALLLIRHGADLSVTDVNGNTPLHLSAYHANEILFQLLLKKRPDLVDIQNDLGNTALHEAIGAEFKTGVELLLKLKPNLSLHNNLGMLPLHTAAAADNVEFLKMLLSAGANPFSLEAKNQGTAFHIAVINSSLKTAKFLLALDPRFLTKKDGQGFLPVHWASLAKDSSAIFFLKKLQADFNEQENPSRNTPLHLAVMQKRIEHVKILLMLKVNVGMKNLEGNTALHLAVLSQEESIASVLLENEAPINEKNKDGNTALHLAAASGEVSLIYHLLFAKADLFIANSCGETPADLLQKQHPKIYKFFSSKSC